VDDAFVKSRFAAITCKEIDKIGNSEFPSIPGIPVIPLGPLTHCNFGFPHTDLIHLKFEPGFPISRDSMDLNQDLVPISFCQPSVVCTYMTATVHHHPAPRQLLLPHTGIQAASNGAAAEEVIESRGI
jgi:hypothetical protein